MKRRENFFGLKWFGCILFIINCDIIFDHFPLHVSDLSNKLNKKIITAKMKMPYNLLRSYLNDDIALYFCWIEYYTKFLIIPALFSYIMVL